MSRLICVGCIAGAFSGGGVMAQECDPMEAAKLLASDGVENDQLGYSVSISGDTAVIGARRDGDNGSAYIFARSEGVWAQEAKLVPTGGNSFDNFGFSVAMSGNTAVVGAFGDDDNGIAAGAAYVFIGTGGVWTQQAKISASDGAADDRFGLSVSIDGDTIMIGAWQDDDSDFNSGSAYAFTRTGSVWTEQDKLLASDGAVGDGFGFSVSVNGDSALIAAYLDQDNGGSSGSAYVFTRTAGEWAEQDKLVPADGEAGNFFGYSVSMSGDTAVLGAAFDQDNGSDSGSAYIFTRTGGVWAEQVKLLPSDGAAGDRFGTSVSMSGDTVVIGAFASGGFDTGAGYVYTRSGGLWTQQSKIVAGDPSSLKQFGFSVSVSDDTAMIGANQDNAMGIWAGAAYAFDLGCGGCAVDFTGEGDLDIFDILAFLDAFNSGDASADFTGEGDFDIFDILAFLDAFNAGCP